MAEDRPEMPVSGFSRRALLCRAPLAIGGGALVTLLATAPAQAKMTQQAAGYQATPKDGKNCAGCGLFKAPSSCTLVDGTIAPEGWCRFYMKKS